MEVTKRVRVADGFFARYQAKEDGEIVTFQIAADQYPDQPKQVTLPKGKTWVWLFSWSGAVFDTATGLLDTAGDFYEGDKDIPAIYMHAAGVAQPIEKTDFVLAGTTLTLSNDAITKPVIFETVK